MKSIVMVIAVLVLLSSLSLAQVDDEIPSDLQPEQAKAGTTPDSPFYPIDLAFDNIKVALAKDKVRANLKVANERLAEAKVMTTRGKDITKVLERRQHRIDKALLLERETDGASSKVLQEVVNRHTKVLLNVSDSIRTDKNLANDRALAGLNVAINKSRKAYVDSSRNITLPGLKVAQQGVYTRKPSY